LSAYPAAEQAGLALAGIKSASDGMEASAKAAEAEAKEELRAEIQRAEDAKARAETASADLAASRQSERALKSEIEDLRLQLARAQEKTADSASALAPAESSAAAAAREGRIADLEAEVERLAATATRYDELISTYKEYRVSGGEADAMKGSQALVAASAKLDSFLASDAARQSLPGLRESVARYQQAYLQAGQREVLFNALDLLEGAVRLRDAAARERYFSDLEKRFAGDEGMLAFISGLRRNVK